jgi:hypothetical protein
MPQRLLIFALALLALGLGIYAYRQSNARAAVENQLRALESKLAQAPKPPLAEAARPADASPLPAPQVATPAKSEAPGPSVEQLARIDTPERQRLMNLRTRSALDTQYASLFKYLALPPDQLQKLQKLLQDRRNVFHEVVTVMRNQGMAPTAENAEKIQALVNNAVAEIDKEIRSTLGDNTYAKYRSFEITQGQRQTADRVQQRLSYTAEPLTDPQYYQLVDVIIQGGPQSGDLTKADATTRSSRGNAVDSSLITPAVFDQARIFLSPAQLAALQQIQAEIEASAQLSLQEAGER